MRWNNCWILSLSNCNTITLSLYVLCIHVIGSSYFYIEGVLILEIIIYDIF